MSVMKMVTSSAHPTTAVGLIVFAILIPAIFQGWNWRSVQAERVQKHAHRAPLPYSTLYWCGSMRVSINLDKERGPFVYVHNSVYEGGHILQISLAFGIDTRELHYHRRSWSELITHRGEHSQFLQRL
jgi:hypothetical protein